MATNHPNIIYILADDMGYGDVSCLNEASKIQTSHLDRMASEGMVFRDAHASSAVCTPSRYSILTGRYNWRSALKQGVTYGYDGPLIEQERITAASFLKQHGYDTACFGKWHLGWDWSRNGEQKEAVDFSMPIENGPTTRGFDYFLGISASLDMPPYVYIENEQASAIPDRIIPERKGKEYYREGPIAPDFRHEDVLPTLTDSVVGYIDDKAKRNVPFFVYFPLPAPHTPILPTEAFQGKSGANEYGDFCLQVDDVVKRVMHALDRNGIAGNTILIFTSDNGCSPMADFKELAEVGHQPSYVFRGHKSDIYEGGHRIPLIVRWPERILPGTVSDETVCLSDLLATCADIVDDVLPDNAGEDSVSNLPVWAGEKTDKLLREATVHTSIDGSLSIRQGRWKLEMCPGSGGWSDPKPGKDCEGLPPMQLYDLEADIGECENVYTQYPETAEKLKDLLTGYILRGRSTPGTPQQNTGGRFWDQLWWMTDETPPEGE